jgi:glycosyltransferase involved in cell wall biosynthesis
VKIAYVALHLEGIYLYGGVGVKIHNQMHFWKKFGHETNFFILSPDVDSFNDASIFPYPKRGNLLGKENLRSQALARLIQAVRDYRPDVIYLRYGLYTWPLQKLAGIAPVFVEINTDDIEEYKYRGRLYYWINRLTRGQILSRCTGLVPISREIANLPENACYHKPACVIANGIDMDALVPLPPPKNPAPRLAFVGTAGIPWNGEDKLWPFARRFPDLTIDMIGFQADAFPQGIPANVVFHGRVSVAEVRFLLGRADVAIGTLALHRKKLNENSPLKVRESLGYGVPTVIAYQDTDLEDQNFDFLLKLPNCETNLADHADEVRDFTYRMCGQRADREAIWPLIDQGHKEQKRLEFFSTHMA